MSELEPAAIRAAALANLGASTEPRIADALHQAIFSVEPDVSTWEASEGRIRGHRIHIGLPASALGMVRAHPYVADQVTHAVSVAVAASTHHHAVDVVFHYDATAARTHAIATPYRGGIPHDTNRSAEPETTDLGGRAYEYLAASGAEAAASLAKRAQVELADAGSIVVTLARDDDAADADLSALKDCLCDLAGVAGKAVRITVRRAG